jgi:hypothetical protein
MMIKNVELKICYICKKEKPMTDFYKNRSKKDGHCNGCKTCHRHRRRSEKWKAIGRRYRQTEKGKSVNREITKRYKEKNPHKVIAHSAIYNAIIAGKLKREPCEICGSTLSIQGHHEDYANPYDVIWLCIQHHKDLHQNKLSLNPKFTPPANGD